MKPFTACVRPCFASVLLIAVTLGHARAEAPDDAVTYPWQVAHARVLPTGDLEWTPRPFTYDPGPSVRYIDFDRGDDRADGTSPDTAWKHHPWDPQAQARAADAAGPHTYVFKRGVIYRGALVADESGRPDRPIVLTSDPAWGDGEAMWYGSVALTGGWNRLTAEQAPASMPEPEKVWYRDVGTDFFPRSLWMENDGRITRIALARDPNWTVVNQDDVCSQWHEWRHTEREQVPGTDEEHNRKAWGFDAAHLTAEAPDAYVGGTVWTEYSGVMGTPYPVPIEAYDPKRGGIRFAGPWNRTSSHYHPVARNRYYLENLPRFLDAPGEYYYRADGEHAGRLFVRLPEDLDPNTVRLELAKRVAFLDIRDRRHIHVSGLTFRFGNVAHWYDRWWTLADQDAACVRVLGRCEDVRVSNCLFEHVPMAVRAEAASDGVMDRVAVTDNDIYHTDYGAIDLSHGGVSDAPLSQLRRVAVLRNRLRWIGLRPMRAHHGHALAVHFAALPHVAGNVLDRCYGAGVFVFGGKGSGEAGERALSRVMIHHNRVTRPIMRSNDWGGVETWQGGPHYVFNNVSGNPGGYWHFSHVGKPDPAQRSHTTARFGFAYYLDGSFKNYVFNNIAWGASNDLASPLANTTGLQEIIGFQNTIFHNTFYRFVAGARRQAPQAGRNKYLANVWQDMSELYFRHANPRYAEADRNAADAAAAGRDDRPYGFESLAYARNVFHGSPRAFGVFEHTGVLYESIASFREALRRRNALHAEVGTVADRPPLRHAEAHDFRPAPGSAAIDRGARVFVPWSLYATVGEWGFYRPAPGSHAVLDEHFYMTDQHDDRGMYRHVPRHDLTLVDLDRDDFVAGPLEDWTPGALRFDGQGYARVRHEDMAADWVLDDDPDDRVTPPPVEHRRTLDMTTNSFLIEAYLRGDPDHAGGVIVSKIDPRAGYWLATGENGGLVVRLRVVGEQGFDHTHQTAAPIHDGRWHHVVVEVDRTHGAEAQGERGLRLSVHVDDQTSRSFVSCGPDASLANEADFIVGRGPDGRPFRGEIDFLRVARGTLADAHTTLDELRAWQFDGPFLRDFAGRPPHGPRDAGAIESRADEPVSRR